MSKKKKRSKFAEAELYEALLAFTDPKSPQFDPVFTEEIKRVAPHWRVEDMPAEEAAADKQTLIDFAKTGQTPPPRDVEAGQLFSKALAKHCNPKSATFDAGFTAEIRVLAPAWLAELASPEEQVH
jgi:hypothetical protein